MEPDYLLIYQYNPVVVDLITKLLMERRQMDWWEIEAEMAMQHQPLFGKNSILIIPADGSVTTQEIRVEGALLPTSMPADYMRAVKKDISGSGYANFFEIRKRRWIQSERRVWLNMKLKTSTTPERLLTGNIVEI